MTKIAPFKALVYNQEKIKDLSQVVCPPYDIISPAKQIYYHESSPYNLIHILLGRDIAGEDKYRRAKRYFGDWLEDQILLQEKSPAIYFYSQQYHLRGEVRTRLGFIALLGLESKGKSIFGHEHTRLEPKEDRLRLLRQVKANLSPIFAVFSDHKRIIQRTYQQHVQDQKPFIDIVDDEKTAHKLWKLDSPEVISGIISGMSAENIFIADGHHRYEVACAYREELKKKLGGIPEDAGCNYILSYFTNVESRGLSILPIHRLVKLNPALDVKNLLTPIGEYFDIEEIKEKERFFFLLEKAGETEHVLGMYKDRIYRLLRLKNIKMLDKMAADKSKLYRSLDVSILNYLVLKTALKMDLDDKEGIVFSANTEELIGKVNSDGRFIAFFLNPVKMREIMSIALSGERMPAKSTYFYPKVLSGLVVNKFD
ncbi:MAG: DUF1015 domain-containing protein [Candidatus Omnitrophota bacterium]|jgi:uncharacterized protein (DUF1015 family)